MRKAKNSNVFLVEVILKKINEFEKKSLIKSQ